MRQFLIILAVLVSLLGFPESAFAHSVETNYHLQADLLEIEAVFSTGEAFEDADVVVHPPSESDIPEIQGLTDQEGKFIFEPDYSIVGDWSVEIGEGSHWDKLVIPVSDRGIDVDAISQTHYDLPHYHFNFGRQLAVVEIALCFGLFGQYLKNRLKF